MTPSAAMGASDFCAWRMWKMRSCLRSAPGASMLRSLASLASWRIFISLSSVRFIGVPWARLREGEGSLRGSLHARDGAAR